MLIDFCGFTFNGIHSSELNIIRTSNGSRFNESLGAAFQDKTAPIEGGDGLLFWNSFYTNKPFSFQFAYDSLTEAQKRKLSQVFCAKAMGELILDETPYKAYTVKVQSPLQLNYIPFDDKEGNRVYKGEGTVQFIAYSPYAKSVHKYLDEFDDFYYWNKQQWAESTGMLLSKGTYDGTGGTITVYNPGDIETDWQAYYTMTSEGCALRRIELEKNGVVVETLGFSDISLRKNTNDSYLRINSRTQLVEGCDSNGNPTGSLYNEFNINGEFFKILFGEFDFKSYGENSYTPCVGIKYTYLYY